MLWRVSKSQKRVLTGISPHGHRGTVKKDAQRAEFTAQDLFLVQVRRNGGKREKDRRERRRETEKQREREREREREQEDEWEIHTHTHTHKYIYI